MIPVLLSIAFADPPSASCTMIVRTTTGSPRVDSVATATGSRATAVATAEVGEVFGLHDLVRDGTDFLTCSGYELQAIATADGVATSTGTACTGVASGEEGLLVVERWGPTGRLYASSAALARGDAPIATPNVGAPSALALDGADALSVAFGKNIVRRWSLADGALLSSVTLEDARVPIRGLSVLDGVLFVLDDSRSEAGEYVGQRILAFDPDTGSLLGLTELSLERGELARGLLCEAP